jgi:hypothetical protein
MNTGTKFLQKGGGGWFYVTPQCCAVMMELELLKSETYILMLQIVDFETVYRYCSEILQAAEI